jgi:hypothetical protein
MRFFSLLVFLLTSLLPVSAQQTTDPASTHPALLDLDSLCDCVRQRFTLLLDAELEALKLDHKGQWLKYLPSAGMTYDIQGRLRPAVSVNSSTIYTARRDKRQLAARRESIRKRLMLEEARVLSNLIRKHQRLVAEVDRADRLAGIAEIDRELFYLYQEQYKNEELMPEDFLLKKKAFLLQEMRGQEQEEKLLLLRYEIEDLAQCLEPAQRPAAGPWNPRAPALTLLPRR